MAGLMGAIRGSARQAACTFIPGSASVEHAGHGASLHTDALLAELRELIVRHARPDETAAIEASPLGRRAVG
jgi:hypothetical protein